MRLAAQPGLAPEPLRLTQCLTSADAKDPSKLLGGLANPGASGCNYTDKEYLGNRFHFAMQCGGAMALQSQGEVRFSSDSMSGTIVTVANVGGARTELSNKVSARRIGGC